MTARLFTLHPVKGFRPKTFAGHKDSVMGAYFSADSSTVRLLSFIPQRVSNFRPDIHR